MTFRLEEEPVRTRYTNRPGEPCDAESITGRFQSQERERHVLSLLDRHGLLPLSGKRILEVGCGTGKWLRDLIAWGADPETLHGVELLQASAARARRLCPQAVSIECGNAAALRFDSNSFDIVLQANVFTSVLDHDMKRNMAAEMLRVLRPEGLIIWYDFLLTTPGNPYVQPVPRAEIDRLFPGCSFDFRRVALAQPFVRLLARRSWPFCALLAKLSPLCTHYLGAVRKPALVQ